MNLIMMLYIYIKYGVSKKKNRCYIHFLVCDQIYVSIKMTADYLEFVEVKWEYKGNTTDGQFTCENNCFHLTIEMFYNYNNSLILNHRVF